MEAVSVDYNGAAQMAHAVNMIYAAASEAGAHHLAITGPEGGTLSVSITTPAGLTHAVIRPGSLISIGPLNETIRITTRNAAETAFPLI